jgi:hypothetical protein
MRDDADHATDTALCLDCRHIVRDLIRKYGWALLSEDELVELVLGSVESGIPPPEVARLAKHHYAIATYEACWQDKDHDRREHIMNCLAISSGRPTTGGRNWRRTQRSARCSSCTSRSNVARVRAPSWPSR